MDTDTNHTVSHWIANTISGGTVLSAVMGYTPAIAAIVGLVWYLIQIYESATIQHWIAGRRVRRLARLKARVLMLEAQAHRALPMPKSFGEDG